MHLLRHEAALVFTLALLVRLTFCFAVYRGIADQFGDSDGYGAIAANLVHARGYVFDNGASAVAERLPLYPALLAISIWVFGAADWPWQLAQCLCGAATCAVVYTTARRFCSRGGALVGAVCCVVHPTLTLFAARPMTETLYTLLLLLLVRNSAIATVRPGSAGVLFGLQLLTRNTAVLQLAAFIPALVHRRVGRVARAMVLTAGIVLPWVVWNVWSSGHANLVTARGGITLYHGLYISQHTNWTTPTGDLNKEAEFALWHDLLAAGIAVDADVERRDQFAAHAARGWIVSHPVQALRLWARNLVLTWYLGRSRLSMAIHFVLHGFLLVAAAVGAWRLWRTQPAAHDLVIAAALLIGAYTAVHAAVQPAVRYILPVVPLAAVLAAGALPRRSSSETVALR